MLVILPTYKRLDCLRFTLQSMFRSSSPEREDMRLCVVSNDPFHHNEVAKVIESAQDDFDSAHHWTIRIICRPKTLDPIKSWYSAVSEHALPNEAVVLQGDDDLFMPRSFIQRHRAIRDSDADMILNRTIHGLTYLDSIHCQLDSPISVNRFACAPYEIAWAGITRWGPAFIGNHVYRWTDNFKNALDVAFEWCHKQDWLDFNTRTLMLPYYLPFAVKQVGGGLYGLDSVCVIRGGSLAENTESRYGARSWNSLFLNLCTYGVLTDSPLSSIPELDGAREENLRLACRGYAGYFLDNRISPSIRKETFARIHPPWMRYPWELAYSFRNEITHFLRLRAIKLRLYKHLGLFRPVKTAELIETLGKDS